MTIDYNPYSLSGKTILVVGASSGIGQATAVECSRLGAIVIAVGRNEIRLQQTLSSMTSSDETNHQYIIADLLCDEDIEKIINEVPNLDGLMLSAGKGLTLPIQFATRDKFDEMFNINFFSQVELLRILFKKKKLNKGASVVLMSSLGGTQVFSGGNGIYGASKAALNSIMRFCAKEFAPRKVRVNSICPGMVDTPLIHRGTVSEEQLQEDMKRYPLKRYGTPEDIAHLAVFLLGDASSWITGQDFIIDGGVSIK